jgi:hypothetical protein
MHSLSKSLAKLVRLPLAQQVLETKETLFSHDAGSEGLMDRNVSLRGYKVSQKHRPLCEPTLCCIETPFLPLSSCSAIIRSLSDFYCPSVFGVFSPYNTFQYATTNV